MRLSRIREYLGPIWRRLLAVHVAFTVLAFAVITPLFGLLLRGLLALSGNTAVADQDIALLMLSPMGLAGGILLLGTVVMIIALELGALMAVVVTRDRNPVSTAGAVLFALRHAPRLLVLACLLVVRVGLYLIPWALAVGAIYLLLLSAHDINYYLSNRPREWYLGLGTAALPTLGLAFFLGRRLLDWSLVLPSVLLGGVGPRQCFAHSQAAVAGHRKLVLRTLANWLLIVALLGLVSGVTLDLAWGLAISRPHSSLDALVLTLSLLSVLWFTLNVVTTALVMATFVIAEFWLYRQLLPGKALALPDELSGDRLRLPAPGLVVTACLAGLAVWAAGAWLVADIDTRDDVLIVAHRGAAGAAPENTLAAVRRALDDGADWVEIDVQETRDGGVVFIHDSDFMKIAGNPLRVWNGDLATIREIDVGSWFDPAFADQRVPTLGEVLDAVRGKARLVIELKYYGHDRQLEQRVIDTVEAHDMAQEVALMSLSLPGIEKARALRPGWHAGLLAATAVGDLSRLDMDFLAVNAGMANRRFIQRAHQRGRRVLVWTVNDPASMSYWMSRGVDGIITDEPAMARQVLAERAELSPAERLLVNAAMLFGRPVPTGVYRDNSP